MTDDSARNWQWKMREVASGLPIDETAIEIYDDRFVIAILAGASRLQQSKKAASLIVAAPELLRVCQDVLRETTQEDGTPQEIMERMLDVVMRAQAI